MNYDIVGDVHGCFDELTSLLAKLGYKESVPQGDRRLLFVGDLIDRGPHNQRVLRLVLDLRAKGLADCILGNHDFRLLRALRKEPVKRTKNLRRTLKQIEQVGPEFQSEVIAFL